MSKFICVSEDGKRALFFAPSLNRKRIYRRRINEKNKQFKIFEYISFTRAQFLCETINEAYNENFKPELVELTK